MKRTRFRDKTKVGRSSIVPFRPNEDAADRHWRRMSSAMEHRGELALCCKEMGLTLVISNGGHHWRILDSETTIVQWWPSSAKCVVGSTVNGRLPRSNWKNGIHVHDWKQLTKIIMDYKAV